MAEFSSGKTISLIGMPGCGKSSTGVLLAKLLGVRFIDTDLDIQLREQCTLQESLERHGYQHLRDIEAQVLLDIDLHNAVVATGGSAVYSTPAMGRLRSAGPLVYLHASCDCLLQRITKSSPRGIASPPDQNFSAIYDERTPLYQRWATITANAQSHGPGEVADNIMAALTLPQGPKEILR